MIQLGVAQQALAKQQRSAFLTRMNAERLAYATNGFDTVVIFFLLHELPADARQRALQETLRVLKPGGRLLLVEYAENHRRHFLHRAPWRWILEKLEPFLQDFWLCDITQQLRVCAENQHKLLTPIGPTSIFGGFYRVEEYRV